MVIHRSAFRVGLGPKSSAWPAVLLALVLGCNRTPPETRVEPPETKAEPPAQAAPSVALVEELAQARRSALCVDTKATAHAVELYMVRYGGACPARVEELIRTGMIARMPDGGSSWTIACSDTDVIISAPGADGQLGTPDDVVQGGPQANCEP